MLKEILKPLDSLNIVPTATTTTVFTSGFAPSMSSLPHPSASVTRVDDAWDGRGVDTSPLINECKVPGLLLRHQDTWWENEYFHLHHTMSDTIDHVDPKLLIQNLQVITCTTWILANSPERLPTS